MKQLTKNDIALLFIVAIIVVAGSIFFASTPVEAPADGTPQQDDSEICIQVITTARNPDTGEVVEFPTPCDVPEGWEIVK